jgi:RNA polymerase sigma-70 factor (ECF subfamily)
MVGIVPQDATPATRLSLLDPLFPATMWSVVVAAGGSDGPEAAQALERLARGYWRPLYVFVRQRGLDHHAASDAVQGFFAHLLARDFLRSVRPREGRFRSFLIACFKNWLADERARAHAAKRGGGREFVSLEELQEARDALAGSDLPPEESFDRDWARAIVRRALARLAAEWEGRGRGAVFSALRDGLEGEASAGSYAEVGARLALSANAVKCAVLDLRQRYALLVREEITATVRDPSEVEDELRYLVRLLRT